jgi:hypothetical protein
MFRSFLKKSSRGNSSRQPLTWAKKARAVLRLTALESRLAPAITATFSATDGLLTIIGDGLDNNIVASRDAAGTILVNQGAVQVQGGTPTVANTVEIRIFGLRGDDTWPSTKATALCRKRTSSAARAAIR